MRHQFFTPATNRVLIAVGFILGLGLLVYSMAGMPNPSAQYRLESVDRSYSIIHPPEWDARSNYLDTSSPFKSNIVAAPPKVVGRDMRFTVSKFRAPPDLAKLQASGFKPAKFQSEDVLTYTINKYHEYAYTMVFQRSGSWYQINVLLQREEDIPGGIWWKYFDTFQAKPVSTSPATLPGG